MEHHLGLSIHDTRPAGPPSPVTATSAPILSPLTDGDTLADAVTWPGWSSTAGAITGTERQMRLGGGAWLAYAGATQVEAGQTWQVRERASDDATPPNVAPWQASAVQLVAEVAGEGVSWIEADQVPSNGVTLFFDAPVHYRLAPDGSAEIRRFDARVVGTFPAGTATRNGAMLNPRRGLPGFGGSISQGFDSRIREHNGGSVWNAALNVNPDATGVPLAPAPGDCLVCAVSNDETMPLTASGQRRYGGVQRYAIFRFTDAIQPATRLRPGVRSSLTAVPSTWTTATLLAARPRFRTLPNPHSQSTRAARLNRLRQPNNFWISAWNALDTQMSRSSQAAGYGDYFKDTYGWALYYLHTDLTDAEWLEWAIGVAQVGIDLWHSALDGMVFQSNGAWMHSRQEIVAVTGVLLNEPAMINAVAAPLSNGFADPPWLKTIHYVTENPRTDGNFAGIGWGLAVGQGGAAQTVAGRPRRIPNPPEVLGHPGWTIESYDDAEDLNKQGANTSLTYMGQNWANMMISVLAFGLCDLPAGSDVTGYYPVAHFMQRMLQVSKKVYDGLFTATELAHTDGHNRLDTYGAAAEFMVNLYLSEIASGGLAWPAFTHPRPEISQVPRVEMTAGGAVVTFSPRAESYGFPIVRRDVRWSNNGGASWTVITGVTSPYTIAGAQPGDWIGVRLVTDQPDGEGAWSTNLPAVDFFEVRAGIGTGQVHPSGRQVRWSFNDGATWTSTHVTLTTASPELPPLPGRVQWRDSDADPWIEVPAQDIEWVGRTSASHPPAERVLLLRPQGVVPALNTGPVDPPVEPPETEDFALSVLPADRWVFPTAGDLVEALVVWTGTGTPGVPVRARGYHPDGSTDWYTGTVAGDGTWRIEAQVPRAQWQGRWYVPEAEVVGAPDSLVQGANRFGCGLVITILGQSEPAYPLLTSGFYTGGVHPAATPDNFNLLAWQSGAAVFIPVTPENNAARAYPTAVTAMATMMALAVPDAKVVIVNATQSGTSFVELMDDQNPGRSFVPFQGLVDYLRSGNSDVSQVIWCWWNSTASGMKSPLSSFGPGLLGMDGTGAFYDIADPATTFDHTFFDAFAPENQRGRGVFRRNRTKFIFMPPGLRVTADSLASTPNRNYSTNSSGAVRSGMRAQNDRPAIDAGAALMANPAWGPAAGGNAISPTICRFGDYLGGVQSGSATAIHPSIGDPRGTRLFAMHIMASSLCGLGVLTEPRITGATMGPGGAYADVQVSLPAGGSLTTLRTLDAIAAPDPLPPHWQPVMGFEIRRAGDADADRRPVHRADDTSVPAAYRGTVVIHDPGTDGVATIRITPVEPFANGDALEFQRGGGFDLDLRGWPDYDARMYLDLPLAHVPALYDGTIHSYPGAPVRPQPPLLVLSSEGPPPPPPDGAFVVASAEEGVTVTWADANTTPFTVTPAVGGVLIAWEE